MQNRSDGSECPEKGEIQEVQGGSGVVQNVQKPLVGCMPIASSKLMMQYAVAFLASCSPCNGIHLTENPDCMDPLDFAETAGEAFSSKSSGDPFTRWSL